MIETDKDSEVLPLRVPLYPFLSQVSTSPHRLKHWFPLYQRPQPLSVSTGIKHSDNDLTTFTLVTLLKKWSWWMCVLLVGLETI